MSFTPGEELEGAVWRVLRQTYLRFAAGPLGAERLSPEEENLALDPHLGHLESDHRLLMEVVRTAFSQGASQVHTILHGRPGVDHEMLDQAVEYAALDTGGRDE